VKQPEPAPNRAELSIVIAVRDAWRPLTHCLDSISAQYDSPTLDIVIVDDGSALRASAAAAERMRQMQVRQYRQARLGIAAARNRGLSMALGKLVLFIDSDCILERHCLRRLTEAARLSDSVAFQLAISSPKANLLQEIEALRLKLVQTSLVTKSEHIYYANTSGFVLRASYLHEWFFDMTVIRGSDTLMLAKLLKDGHVPKYLPSCQVFHCPQMALRGYITKHFVVGYHGVRSKQMLRKSGGRILGWRAKFWALRQLGTLVIARVQTVPQVAGGILCLAVEKLGQTSYRLVRLHSGKRKLLLLNVDGIQPGFLLQRIITSVESKRGLVVSYASTSTLLQSLSSHCHRVQLNSVDICFIVGSGIPLASALFTLVRLPSIVKSDFLIQLCRDLADRNMSTALLGTDAKAVSEASRNISDLVPGLRIQGEWSAESFLTPEELISKGLLNSQPHVVLIFMGQPQQEEWALSIKRLMPTSVVVCIGDLSGASLPSDN
jgi:UDP-N-acetyl-D-mannosaminuronic acid transferase (WecB/TagA/CpsF family)/glycosyltransferase involved in cell wall biosynthesis